MKPLQGSESNLLSSHFTSVIVSSIKHVKDAGGILVGNELVFDSFNSYQKNYICSMVFLRIMEMGDSLMVSVN